MQQDRPPDQAGGAEVSADGASFADVPAPADGPAPEDEPVSQDEPASEPASLLAERPDEPAAAPASVGGHRLAKAIAIYTLIRVGLMAVLTAALMWVMPLIVALAFAVVLQLPLAFLLFSGPRRELTGALAQARARQHAERDQLRAQLMGEGGQQP